jgi:hypothetical protein
MRNPSFFCCLLLALSSVGGCTQQGTAEILLTDGFDQLKVGMFSTFVKAHTEYHYRPDAAPQGNWAVSTQEGEIGSQRAWWIFRENDINLMAQTYDNPDVHTHPMIIAGDSLWADYTVTASFAPESDKKESGVVFRYQNDRCYYFFGVQGQNAILKMGQHGTAYREPLEQTLAQSSTTYAPGEYLTAVISVKGSQIRADLNQAVVLEADDSTYSSGKIGLTSDVPTRFRFVRVTTSTEAKERFTALRNQREQEETRLQAANPKMVLWKKVETPKFGVGRNLRFGDLDNEILWQIGQSDLLMYFLTNDVGMQIHDLAGDGHHQLSWKPGNYHVLHSRREHL